MDAPRIYMAKPCKSDAVVIQLPSSSHDQVTNYTPQTKVTVTAEDPANGYKFTGWKTTNGTYVSYDMTYTFIIAGDTTLIPEYVLDQTIVEKKPSIYVSEPVYIEKEQGVSQRATMYFNYDIPEGYTLKDIGVIYTAGMKEKLTLEDVDGTNTVMRSALSTITNSANAAVNQFYYYKTVTKDAASYTLCGYIVVEGSKGREVFYTALNNVEYQNN